MKRVMRISLYFIIMISLLILFLPKVNLYYAAEQMMKAKNIYISKEEAKDTGFSLELHHAAVYFDKLDIMQVQNIQISPWLIYNSLTLDNIEINEGFSDFVPLDIKVLKAEHVIYNPTHIKLSGSSSDSFFYGDVNLLERIVIIHLRMGKQSQKRYKVLLKKFTKEEGGYVYEYKF